MLCLNLEDCEKMGMLEFEGHVSANEVLQFMSDEGIILPEGRTLRVNHEYVASFNPDCGVGWKLRGFSFWRYASSREEEAKAVTFASFRQENSYAAA